MVFAARLLLLAATIACLGAQPSRAQEGSWEQTPDGREFRAWSAYCHPDMLCFAETYPLEGVKADYQFRLMRRRGEATWNIVLSTMAARPAFPYEIYATIDGNSFAFDRHEAIAAYGQASDLYLLGAEAQRLMDALGPGKEI